MRLTREQRLAAAKARIAEAKSSATGSGYEDGLLDFSRYPKMTKYKPATRNYLDFIPYWIKTDIHPQKVPHYDYKLDIWAHKDVGIDNQRILCLKKTYKQRCPICEERDRLLDSGVNWKSPEVSALKPVRRCIYNVIDLNEPDKGIQIFERAFAHFEKLLIKEVQENNDCFFFDVDEGLTVAWRGEEEKFGNHSYMQCERIDFEKRESVYPEEVMDEAIPLDQVLKIPTYEYVRALFLGEELPEEGYEVHHIEEDEEEQSIPQKKETPPPKPVREDATEIPDEKPTVHRRKRIKEPAANVCPFNHTFGTDNQEHEDCDSCPNATFDLCVESYEKLSA